ncbi:metastasis-associated protein MTA1-like [Diaphorina citri]|uniref:Metastasis-associated protein MTA1-like n=1 Tax=Diaphorina citri TaxID=121845 RepID=A0A1S3D3Q5_DIACI|nr:metastasis-associated protein MTA1-like [Diaphorina citri]
MRSTLDAIEDSKPEKMSFKRYRRKGNLKYLVHWYTEETVGALELDSSDESSEISSINNGTSTTDNGHPGGTSKELTNKQKHQLKQRELFLSRQVETLPATHIRGKCSVTLLNETESLLSYLNKERYYS